MKAEFQVPSEVKDVEVLELKKAMDLNTACLGSLVNGFDPVQQLEQDFLAY